MSKILADLTQSPQQRQFASAVVKTYDAFVSEPGKPVGAKIKGKNRPTGRWNSLSFPERVPTTLPPVEIRASGGRRQHQAHTHPPRLYRPQDQRGVQSVFVIMDRQEGQVLARVRGNAAHAEIEAEKLAQNMGVTLADLIVRFEGELPEGGMVYVSP